jgi:hypothetical protein
MRREWGRVSLRPVEAREALMRHGAVTPQVWRKWLREDGLQVQGRVVASHGSLACRRGLRESGFRNRGLSIEARCVGGPYGVGNRQTDCPRFIGRSPLTLPYFLFDSFRSLSWLALMSSEPNHLENAITDRFVTWGHEKPIRD